MRRLLNVFIFMFSFCSFSFAADAVLQMPEDEEDCIAVFLSRSDSIPQESIEGASDPYFEGYIQSLVDMHFFEYRVTVLVKDKTVWLANMPKNVILSDSIMAFVKDVPGVEGVFLISGVPPKQIAEREKYVNRPRLKGMWFPQMTELFQPMIANPRCVMYSAAYRGGDKISGEEGVATQVSFGDDFPFYRWLDVGAWHGDLQVGIETCVWSIFDMKPDFKRERGTGLVNTDFYVGIPVSYAFNKWAYRFRVYHISSHLGDEFLFNHPDYVNPNDIEYASDEKYQYIRVNPSFEAFDAFFSFQANKVFRVYGGAGVVLHSDRDYTMKRGYVEYGGEARFLGTKFCYHKIYGNCIVAVYFSNWQFRNWKLDSNLVAGYEWSKLQGVGRKMRLLGSYHNGFSAEGQFSRFRTHYWTVGIAYGF